MTSSTPQEETRETTTMGTQRRCQEQIQVCFGQHSKQFPFPFEYVINHLLALLIAQLHTRNASLATFTMDDRACAKHDLAVYA